MKKVRKVWSLIMALVMMLALGITAQAADTYTITVDGGTSTVSHTYEAYQVFTGTLSTEGVLSDVQWGTGVNSATLLDALKADATVGPMFTSCASAADVAKAMDGILNDSTEAKAIAQVVGSNLSATVAGTATGAGSVQISNLSAGYYMVKDKDDTQDGSSEGYTRFILKVAKDVTVTPKRTVPTVTKTVDGTNDSTGTIQNGEKSADYDIGDSIPFTLTGTLPTNYADYSTYAYTFHDAMSAGLTFDPASLKVYVDGTQITTGYTVVTTGLTDGCTFEVQFPNLKTIASINADSKIVVTYSATLNSGAVLTSAGNPNTATLEYSNNPNAGGLGDTGKTPGSTTTVFTYQVIINKVDQNNAPLSGAAFTLEKFIKATNSWTPVTVVTNTPDTIFTFSGLDAGLYRLTETTTPAGYNTIDPVYFTITAVTGDTEVTSLTAQQTDSAGNPLATGIVATFTTSTADGSVSTNIVNNTGATLPSTGGIGTTVIYIAGGVLMAGAAILFVIKKKQSGHEN
ncbi:Cell wall surface anchor family protein [Ruminococcaceae bacterium BL-4]|jgi:fimbrial isopeptide formation D2 family protein/LPXTG-motif cell wall-anchored protein|nr:Cell wall surface anchor family protein [Ruminococcaceae bacterium BL-4]